MRANLILQPIREVLPMARRTGLAAGLISAVWLGAAEEPNTRVSRLGFAFDQKAHDQAVAAANATPTPEDGRSDDLLHLAKLVVTEKRSPMSARDALSPSGKLDLAKKTYLSPVYEKTLGPLAAIAGFLTNPLGGFHPNDIEAMTLYENEQQKRRNTEMTELQAMAALSDPGK